MFYPLSYRPSVLDGGLIDAFFLDSFCTRGTYWHI